MKFLEGAVPGPPSLPMEDSLHQQHLFTGGGDGDEYAISRNQAAAEGSTPCGVP